ncbi:MFS transporter [Candidatus Pantoea multigeneris]|uniref:MFS transporter n=1 Tax=Candidatus Pantoea multigeneris TaxID=2608357 RepID=A0ABX0R838_9GAMM|nr:MFS transporter [Pantoea multigeneris]NIF21526.1 MFS transporter [Pantoea multigeneris]
MNKINVENAIPLTVNSASDQHTGSKALKRVVVAAMAGSFIEWFEFSVYGYMAAVMGKIFFTNAAPAVQLIASFATFAVAFIARPVGGMVFGIIGDKIGRKTALNITLLLMAAATFCIGLLPSESSIGVTAPVLLILLRLIQGFSSGGEVAGASIFVAEHSQDKHRTFMTSWVEVGCISGFIFGALTTAVLHFSFTEDALLQWAWRLPFMLAAPMALIGLYIRHKLEESPLFVKENQAAKSVSRPRLATQKKSLLISSGLIIGANIPLFIILTYMPSWLVSTLNLTAEKSLLMTVVPMFFLMMTIPLFGKLADRLSRKKIMSYGYLGMMIFSFPCFIALRSGEIALQFLALLSLNMLLSMLLSCILAKIPSLFQVSFRFTGMAISYNVAVALFAGTAPMFNAWLIKVTGNPFITAWYLIAGAAVGLVAVMAAEDKTGQPMSGDRRR